MFKVQGLIESIFFSLGLFFENPSFVWGLGFKGLGLKVQTLGLRVEGLALWGVTRVQGLQDVGLNQGLGLIKGLCLDAFVYAAGKQHCEGLGLEELDTIQGSGVAGC